MTAPHELFASCVPGLEPLLAEELSGLGALSPTTIAGGVTFAGHRAVVHRVCLEAGLASHLLVRVGAFAARHFDALERELAALPWERVLRPDVPRAFTITAKKSRLRHTGAIEERAARAIARRLGDRAEAPARDGVKVHVRLDRDRVTASVDVSGAPLHRRGWREHVAAAPLREDLARALVVASGWDPSTPFVDPCCGGGTLPIVAARMARRMAPGRGRRFDLERTPLFHPPTWARLLEEADARVLDRAPAPIRGADRDAAALDAARHNAGRAGVAEDVDLVQSSLSALPLDDLLAAPGGALVTNPPYGKRLGASKSPAALHRALARRIEGLPPGWRAAVVTTQPKWLPELTPALTTKSGGLRVHFLLRAAARSAA